jgi:hypothetical protein
MCIGKTAPDREKLYAATHRAVLGVLLAIACTVGIGLVGNGIYSGNAGYTVTGLAVVVVTIYWIADLFFEGLRER